LLVSAWGSRASGVGARWRRRGLGRAGPRRAGLGWAVPG
jgi:hypothetical protein